MSESDLTKQLNQRNSDCQLLTEEKKQLEEKVRQLENQIEQYEGDIEQFKLNQENWVKQYNITMDLVYQGAFNLMNIYTNRRLNPVGDRDATSFSGM